MPHVVCIPVGEVVDTPVRRVAERVDLLRAVLLAAAELAPQITLAQGAATERAAWLIHASPRYIGWQKVHLLGLEPRSTVWKTVILPLDYKR